jgi:hypothetical protein
MASAGQRKSWPTPRLREISDGYKGADLDGITDSLWGRSSGVQLVGK